METWKRYLVVALLISAHGMDWETMQATLMLIYASMVLWEDFRGFKVVHFNISTAYAILLAVTSISHMIVLFGWDSNPFYFAKYYSDVLSGQAIFMFNIGSIIITEAMRLLLSRKPESLDGLIVLKRFPYWPVFIVSSLIFISTVYFEKEIRGLGSIGSFYILMINGSVFLLSFVANLKERNIFVTILYSLFLSIWALQYSYLRMEIVIPWVAYLAGDTLARGSIFRLHTQSKTIILVGLFVFPPIFTFLGENRDKIRGSDRLSSSVSQLTSDNNGEGQTIFARLSVIPQLSHIIRLTETHGFYDGQTLEYLGFVFIPRFIWPDKPKIKQGQWFALEIGNALINKQGNATNSINMTVPGEFYLNYGWMGLIVGCVVFGLFIGWLWLQTNYLSFFGWIFRFFLLFLGLFSLGADLQIIPTLLAYLLIYKAIIFAQDQLNSRTQSRKKGMTLRVDRFNRPYTVEP